MSNEPTIDLLSSRISKELDLYEKSMVEFKKDNLSAIRINILDKVRIHHIPIYNELLMTNKLCERICFGENKTVSAFSISFILASLDTVCGVRLADSISLRDKGVLFIKFTDYNQLYVQYGDSLPKVENLNRLEIFESKKFYNRLEKFGVIIQTAGPKSTKLFLKHV